MCGGVCLRVRMPIVLVIGEGATIAKDRLMGELRFVQSEEGSGPHAAKTHGLRFAVFAAYGRAANDAPRYKHPLIRCVSNYPVGVGIVPIGGPSLSIAEIGSALRWER